MPKTLRPPLPSCLFPPDGRDALSAAVARELLRVLPERGMTSYELAARAFLNRRTVRLLESGTGGFACGSLHRMCFVLHERPSAVLARGEDACGWPRLIF